MLKTLFTNIQQSLPSTDLIVKYLNYQGENEDAYHLAAIVTAQYVITRELNRIKKPDTDFKTLISNSQIPYIKLIPVSMKCDIFSKNKNVITELKYGSITNDVQFCKLLSKVRSYMEFKNKATTMIYSDGQSFEFDICDWHLLLQTTEKDYYWYEYEPSDDDTQLYIRTITDDGNKSLNINFEDIIIDALKTNNQELFKTLLPFSKDYNLASSVQFILEMDTFNNARNKLIPENRQTLISWYLEAHNIPISTNVVTSLLSMNLSFEDIIKQHQNTNIVIAHNLPDIA